MNPHDIAFNGFGWDQLLGFGPPDDTVPEIPEAPSQSDSFAGRPPCQEAFKALWPKMIFESDTDLAYRRLYYYLQKVVRPVIRRIFEALEASGMFDDTIIVFTSDHGDLSVRTGVLSRSGSTCSTRPRASRCWCRARA